MNTDFQTPEWVCEIMAGLIPANSLTILEPTSGAGNLANAILRRFPNSHVYMPELFEDFRGTGLDCVVANPPFTPMKKGYQLLEKFFEVSNNIIILMPWLSLINSERRTKNYIEHGLKQVIHLPRKAFEGARVQTCILVFQKGYSGDIVFEDAYRRVSKSISPHFNEVHGLTYRKGCISNGNNW